MILLVKLIPRSIVLLSCLLSLTLPLHTNADIRSDILSSFGEEEEASSVRWLTTATKLRKTPRPSGSVLVSLEKDIAVDLLEVVGQGQWAKVKTRSQPNITGYLRIELLKDSEPQLNQGEYNQLSSSPREIALLNKNINEANRQALEQARQKERAALLARIQKEEDQRNREEAKRRADQAREDREFEERQQAYEDQRRRQSARDWAARTSPSPSIAFPTNKPRNSIYTNRVYTPTPGINSKQTSPASKSTTKNTANPTTSITKKSSPAVKSRSKNYDVVPTVAIGINDTWFVKRERAIEYAQLKGVNQISRACVAKNARLDRNDSARLSYGQPNCQQGGFAGKEWKCEVKVSYPCFTIN